MRAKHPVRRTKWVKAQIARFRRMAFRPALSPYPNVDHGQIELESIIRSRVLLDCAVIEEMAGLVLMHVVLKTDTHFQRLKTFGRTKRYLVLYEAILGRVPARHKLRTLQQFIEVPKTVAKTTDRMLALRDLFAHVATLDYTKRRDLEYKGVSILSVTGFREYLKDAARAVRFFTRTTELMMQGASQPPAATLGQRPPLPPSPSSGAPQL